MLNADEIEAHEEVQPQRDIRTPDMPTQAEMDKHKDNGHAQYRDWCPDRVERFGREWDHTQSIGERHVPLI